MTYHIRNQPRPLYASRLDGLEEIDHSLSFQPLQLSMDADECTSTTNTITARDKVMQSNVQHWVYLLLFYVLKM
jgi:hypothetical protein